MAIDYGTKRVGIAVSDPLQIIATGLPTLPEEEVLDFLADYFSQEPVEEIVVGMPYHSDGRPAQLVPLVNKFVRKLEKAFKEKKILTRDESYTSQDAKGIILQSGIGRKKRRNKALVDKVSAVLILQNYLEERRNSTPG